MGGEERENHEVANLIVELTGASPDLIRHVEDRPGHDRRYSLASERVCALGWEQTVSFEEGLAGTVKWYSENPDWWRPLKSGEYRDYYTRQYADRLGSAPPEP